MKKKKINWRILLIFVLLLLHSFLFAQSETEPDPLCGPNSLLVACKKLGVETNIEELKQLSGYREEEGTTMAGLYRAARLKGLFPVGVKISLDELSKMGIPIIAYLQNKHCVVIDEIERNVLRIENFPEESYLISKSRFSKDYSGFSLLIFKDKNSVSNNLLKKSKTKGPDIRFAEYTYDFGKTKQGGIINHTFKFKNVGREELTISKVEPFYPFLTASLSDDSITPNEKGEIKVMFYPRFLRGFHSASIHVHSNDPVTPLVKLWIQGEIETEPVVSPRYIHFGNVKKGSSVAKKVYYVVRPEDEKLEVVKARSSSRYLKTTVSKSIHEHYDGFEIEVSLKNDIPIGELDEKIIVYTTSEEHPTIEIPIMGNIKGNIEFTPSTFFFGVVNKNKVYESKVTIFTTGKEPLRIERIESPLQFVSITANPKTEGKEYELTATLKNNAPTGIIKGSITVSTNNSDQSRIKIPVYALVQE